MTYKIHVLLPPKLHLSIIKQENNYWCVFYTTYMFYKYFVFESNSIFYNKEVHSLTIISKHTCTYLTLYTNTLQKLFFTWNYFFFAKFKLKGKGFRIYRRRENKFIKFFFGYSHFKIIRFNSSVLLKLSKYKFLTLNSSLSRITRVIKLVQAIKPINLFTKRGLRATHQKISKRRGKSLIF